MYESDKVIGTDIREATEWIEAMDLWHEVIEIESDGTGLVTAVIHQWITIFFEKFFKKGLTNPAGHAIIQVQSRTPRRGERGWTGSRGVQAIVSYD